jgi:regulator of sigma E protease
MSYVLAALGVMLLILLHEAGHFVAAKAVGMRVERFSLFFGPLLIKKRIGETDYGIGPIPLGGYVKITGMNPHEELPPEVEPRAYYRQPVWKRIVVIAAGPFVNLALAFGILAALFLANGEFKQNDHVYAVQSGTPAAVALKPDDRIVSVDGVRGDQDALRAAIGKHECPGGAKTDGCVAATPATVVVVRDGTTKTLHVRPRYSAADERPLLGFQFGQSVPVDAPRAAVLSGKAMGEITGKTLGVFARIFLPEERKQVSSVVGGYKATQVRFSESATQALEVLALISLSLGLINLFPFLPLDGGHIFWALAEKVRGRPISFSVLERASAVGFVLVLLVFAIGLTNDIGHLSNGDFNTR